MSGKNLPKAIRPIEKPKRTDTWRGPICEVCGNRTIVKCWTAPWKTKDGELKYNVRHYVECRCKHNSWTEYALINHKARSLEEREI